MRVFVTGAAGFIGSHLADRLAVRGYDVLGIDTFLTGRHANVSGEWEIVGQDVADCGDSLARYRPDVVVHAAASYSDPSNWWRDVATNVRGAVAVAKNAITAGVERVVYFQTSLCYGLNPPPQPLREDHPLAPRGSYAISKTAGEAYLLQSGLDVVSFRLANIYGPRNLSGPVPAFWKRLAAGEPCAVVDSRRDFVYIDDAIDVFEQAVLGEGAPGVYHVATGGDYPIGDVFYAVQAATGVWANANVVERGADDAPTILLNSAKAAAEFDWAATTPLEEGIARACAWYAEHGAEQTYTHLALGAA